MKAFKNLARFISRIFGVAPEKQQCIVLSPNGELNFDADTNNIIPNVCAVSASYEGNSNPAANTVVRFKVLKGPFVFQKNGSTTIEVRTNKEGKASVDGRLTAKGFAVIVAEVVEDPKASVFFRGHSEGVTDQLFIYTTPCVPADPGNILAKIVAVDRHGLPITGAGIHFEGAHFGGQPIVGTVKEIGNGTYEGIFKTHIAQNYRLMAQDLETHVLTHTHVEVLPGPPHKISFIGSTDPRDSQPYGELLLCAQLQDKYGNPLNPARIHCQADNQDLTPLTVFGYEARFPVKLAGYGNVVIKVSDSESSVAEKITVGFASAWVADPGVVFTGERFTTPLYWLPPADRPVEKAAIKVAFNNELASFENFEPAPLGPMYSPGAEAGNNLVTIPVSSEMPINAKEYPNGIYIGDLSWSCLGEGDTCFSLSAIMSPETPGWEKCVIQKNEEENKKCLCVNIIYKPGDTAARDKGITAVKQVETVISSVLEDGSGNVKVCCPVIEVKVDLNDNTHEMTNAEWAALNADIGGDGTVNGVPDKLKINTSPVGKKANCINVYMIPFNTGSFTGITTVGGPNSAMDPNVIGTNGNQNLGAHEMGHALGAPSDHSDAGGDPDNLMHPADRVKGHGTKLTKDQCKTIWENIDNYPCP